VFSFLRKKICESFRILVTYLTRSEELFKDNIHVLTRDGVGSEKNEKIWNFRKIFMRCDASTNDSDWVKSVKVIVENYC